MSLIKLSWDSMSFRSLLPDRTLTWSAGPIPDTASVVQVPDGLYAACTKTGKLDTAAFCAGGRVIASLRLRPHREVLARYDTYGWAQEYQVRSGQTYLEDFGGRVEGPAYPTDMTFETWVRSRLRVLVALKSEKGSYRPDPKVFLNLTPSEFLGKKALRCATGSASSTGFYPCAFAYLLDGLEKESRLVQAAAGLYLVNPVTESIESSSQVTGFPPTLEYQRVFARAMDDKMDLFLSIFHTYRGGLVTVGLCAFEDLVFAQEGVLGCQKLLLHYLKARSASPQKSCIFQGNQIANSTRT